MPDRQPTIEDVRRAQFGTDVKEETDAASILDNEYEVQVGGVQGAEVDSLEAMGRAMRGMPDEFAGPIMAESIKQRKARGELYPDPIEFAKSKAKALIEKFPDTTDAEIDEILSWGIGRDKLNKAREGARKTADSTGLENAGFWAKAGAVVTTGLDAVSRAASMGLSDVAVKAVAGEEGVKNLRDVEGMSRQALPTATAIAETTGTLIGLGKSPGLGGMRRVAGKAGLPRAATEATAFGGYEAATQAIREAAGTDEGGDPITAGVNGAIMGGVLAAAAPRLNLIAEAIGGRTGQAVKGALENVVLMGAPRVALESGIGWHIPSLEEAAGTTLVMAAFGGARGRGLSDVMRRELGKRGIDPATADALEPVLREAVARAEAAKPPPDPALLEPAKAAYEAAKGPPRPSENPEEASRVIQDAIAKGLVTEGEVRSPERLEAARQAGYEAEKVGQDPTAAAKAALESMPAETRPDGTVAGPTVPTRRALEEGQIEGPARPLVEKVVAEGGDTVSSGVDAEGRPFVVGVDARGETIVERGAAPTKPLAQRAMFDELIRDAVESADRRGGGTPEPVVASRGSPGKPEVIEAKTDPRDTNKHSVRYGAGDVEFTVQLDIAGNTAKVNVDGLAPGGVGTGGMKAVMRDLRERFPGVEFQGLRIAGANAGRVARVGGGHVQVRVRESADSSFVETPHVVRMENGRGYAVGEREFTGLGAKARAEKFAASPEAGMSSFAVEESAASDAIRRLNADPDSGGTTLRAGFDPLAAGRAASQAYHGVGAKADAAVRAGFGAAADAIAKGPLGRAVDRVFGKDADGAYRTHAGAKFAALRSGVASRFLTTEYVASRREQAGTIAVSRIDAKAHGRSLRTVRDGQQRTEADKIIQKRFIDGEMDRPETVEAIGEKAVAALEAAGAATRRNTQRLVDLGRLDASVLDKFQGERTGHYYRRLYESIEAAAREEGFAGEPSRSKQQKIHERKDLTQERRDDLGEITDVAALFDTTLKYQGALIGVAEFQQRMAKTVARDEWQPGYNRRPVENSKRWGPLAGKFLPEQDYRAIQDVSPGVAFKAVSGFNRFWRLGKTGWNPGTWTRNNLWNGFVSHLSGLDAANPADMGYFVNAARTMVAGPETRGGKPNDARFEIHRYLASRGILDSDFVSADVLKTLESIDKAESPTWHGKTWGAVKAIAGGPGKFYAAQDNIWKVAIFLKATAPKARGGLGMDPAVAVDYVRNSTGLPDFRSGAVARVPRSQSAAAGVLLNPFLRGSATVIEYAAKALAAHPARGFAAIGSIALLQQAARNALGLDDEDVKGLNDILPNWSDVSFTTPLVPFRDGDGKAHIVDVTSTVPGAREWKTISGIISGESDVLEGSNMRSIPLGPLPTLAMALVLNRDPMTLRDIDQSKATGGKSPFTAASAATDAEGYRDRLRFVAKVLLPEWTPWLGRSPTKLAEALAGVPIDKAGNVTRDPTMTILQVLGLNVRPLDLDYQTNRRLDELENRLMGKYKGEEGRLSDARISPEDKIQLLKEYEADVGEIASDYARLINEVVPRLRAKGLIK